MPSMLKREFAPISDEAWSELDETAGDVLKGVLTARKLVDFSGPHGWDCAAVNLGRLKVSRGKAAGGVPWGLREVQPLVEVRSPFTLAQMEIDSITRGAADVDDEPLRETVAEAAKFEDDAVFQGFAGGGITGICQASAHKPVKLPAGAEQYPAAVADAQKAMALAGIEGPYALVLAPDPYFALAQAGKGGFPPRRVIEEMIGGGIHMSRSVNGGVLMSTRGGDFELTVGKDFSLGYAGHDATNIEFFVTESFTFRVLEPKAAVALTVQK